ncbi:hypothetical protein [Leptospira kmetyi]|uniref:hypothetical protein n=1 Tax=Leptospira kmetyi TaxID=408139 RepID=UPI0010838CD0|nr:hypothetical protein [Leptospira kmetyi]TGK20282.1 hypothetical protein EHO62_05505 [Leptospira kmetyi]TGK34829.1 hypothetical protein EHO66_00065 [Leptospira kmetyi]
MLPSLKLMTDYHCFPLWFYDNLNSSDNIDPETLPISDALKKRLLNWATLYDQILNLNDPASSNFKSEQDANKFNEEGELLWKLLQEELGGEYKIYYYDMKTSKLRNPTF